MQADTAIIQALGCNFCVCLEQKGKKLVPHFLTFTFQIVSLLAFNYLLHFLYSSRFVPFFEAKHDTQTLKTMVKCTP